MGRREWYLEGRVPLHTLRADVDYGQAVARTSVGAVPASRCWVYKGEVCWRPLPCAARRSPERRASPLVGLRSVAARHAPGPRRPQAKRVVSVLIEAGGGRRTVEAGADKGGKRLIEAGGGKRKATAADAAAEFEAARAEAAEIERPAAKEQVEVAAEAQIVEEVAVEEIVEEVAVEEIVEEVAVEEIVEEVAVEEIVEEAAAEEAVVEAAEPIIEEAATEDATEGVWRGEGDPPEGYAIKGNADSMLYHRPDSSSYGRTKAEVWFDSEESAKSAGFAAAKTHPKSPESTVESQEQDEALDSGLSTEDSSDESSEGGDA